MPCMRRYQEKFYFSPGDTGFKVWDTKFGRIGAAICWDQWFPETARCLALQGAEVGGPVGLVVNVQTPG
jgi:N-carbamoylputrescine amidase